MPLIMRGALALVFATACHQTTSLPLPILDSKTRSLVLVVTSSDEGTAIHALPINSAESPSYPPLFKHGGVDLALLEFGCPLERLGLLAGLQPLEEGAKAHPLLPDPIAVSLLNAQAGQDASWSVGQVPDAAREALQKLPLEETNRCRARQAEIIPRDVALPPDKRTDAAFAVRTDDEHILVGSRIGPYYLVDRQGNVETRTDFEGDRYLGAFRADDGELWLMSLSGKLVRGTLDRGFTVVTTTAPVGREARQLALDGTTNSPGAPFELYAETDARTFLRFDGSSWTLLASSPKYDDIFFARVAWIAPGEAVGIGVGRAANTVVRYQDGKITEELLEGDTGVSTIAHVPRIGTLIGRDDGGVFVHGGSGWTALRGGGVRYYVRVIAAIGDGFIYGASTEINFLEYRFVQHFADTGHCEPARLTEVATTQLVPFADGTFLAATVPGFGDPFGLTLLEVHSAPGSCSGDGDN